MILLKTLEEKIEHNKNSALSTICQKLDYNENKMLNAAI